MTEEGHAFLTRVTSVLTELESAEEAVRAGRFALAGTVRIAMPGVFATRLFLSRVRELRELDPRMLVQTRIVNSAIDQVAEGIDIALTVGTPKDSALIGYLLGSIRWVLVASPVYVEKHGLPVSPADLGQHRCLRLFTSPPQNQWKLVGRSGESVTVTVTSAYEADDSRTLGDAAYEGLGIGVRSLKECSRGVAEGRLVRVLPDYWFEPSDVYALVPRGRTRLPRVVACLDLLRAVVQELA